MPIFEFVCRILPKKWGLPILAVLVFAAGYIFWLHEEESRPWLKDKIKPFEDAAMNAQAADIVYFGFFLLVLALCTFLAYAYARQWYLSRRGKQAISENFVQDKTISQLEKSKVSTQLHIGRPENSYPISLDIRRGLSVQAKIGGTTEFAGKWIIPIQNLDGPAVQVEVVVAEIEPAPDDLLGLLPLALRFQDTDWRVITIKPNEKVFVLLFDWKVDLSSDSSTNLLLSHVRVGTILRFPGQEIKIKLEARCGAKLAAEKYLAVKVDRYGFLDIAESIEPSQIELPLDLSGLICNTWGDIEFMNSVKKLYTRLRTHGFITNGPWFPEAGEVQFKAAGEKMVFMHFIETGDLPIKKLHDKIYIERSEFDLFCEKHGLPRLQTWNPL